MWRLRPCWPCGGCSQFRTSLPSCRPCPESKPLKRDPHRESAQSSSHANRIVKSLRLVAINVCSPAASSCTLPEPMTVATTRGRCRDQTTITLGPAKKHCQETRKIRPTRSATSSRKHPYEYIPLTGYHQWVSTTAKLQMSKWILSDT